MEKNEIRQMSSLTIYIVDLEKQKLNSKSVEEKKQ